jgi:hypothetical protein
LAAEITLVVVLAAAWVRVVRRPKQQRACWQGALLAVALLSLVTLSGLHFDLLPPSKFRLRSPAFSPAAAFVAPESSTVVQVAEPAASIVWPAWFWISGTFAVSC